ncbi:hypothetical protein L1987_39266 [Smallanthus sonchifolius]|uniref:Uncharacterized protein n=1 Tax=Smallanthus sonchifolius TaxID=185202 RepID=A0ACB9HME8_9ASTR|nr:hypothetical protein L1987_39266 [Smallanthus sonchifolius]
MAYLAVELIIFGILAWLTPKDVVRCKSVCREWGAMLSTQEFERAHCSRSSFRSSQRTLFVRESDYSVCPMDFETGDSGPPAIIPFPLPFGVKGVAVLAHLDGLLCVCLHETSELVLWNPTTNAYKHLSTPDGHGRYIDIADTVGLFNGPSNDYNVLHVTRKSNVIVAHIYSRNLGTWRKIAFKTKPGFVQKTFYWSPGTLCRGTMYFTVCE